ncbi:MAG: hypothetical protein ACYDHZ_00595 [Dehalococcoidia bacterium]
MNVSEITYRHIARMLVKSLPLDGDNFTAMINEYTATIKNLPKPARVALRSAYIFSGKVPREEREDLFQELALTLLQAGVTDERLGYSIARCDWQDWWSRYTIRQHYSLDSVVEDEDGNETTLANLIVGEVEFDRVMDAQIDAERIWEKLPANIRPIVQNRLLGHSTNAADRQTLSRWVRATGYQLLMT